jgi:hypothetical protein
VAVEERKYNLLVVVQHLCEEPKHRRRADRPECFGSLMPHHWVL